MYPTVMSSCKQLQGAETFVAPQKAPGALGAVSSWLSPHEDCYHTLYHKLHLSIAVESLRDGCSAVLPKLAYLATAITFWKLTTCPFKRFHTCLVSLH